MKKVLIIGPMPPAIGGIATIVGSLKTGFSEKEGVYFIDSSKPNVRLKRFFRPFKLLTEIFFNCFMMKNGTVLMFSSAYWSFWEKCLWAIVAKLNRKRVVIKIVDGNFPRFYSGLPIFGKKMVYVFMRYIDILGAQSPRWKEYFEKNFPRANVEIITGGVDANFFIPPPDRGKGNKRVKILYVGWLIEAKGIYDLLDAASLMDREGVDYSLRLVGPDPDKSGKIKKYIRDLKLECKVEIVNSKTSREELLNEFHTADIFAFPSHFEGFPYALLEAASSGLPCVATNVGAVPDILDHGNYGIIIEKKSPKKLAKALIGLIKKPGIRESIGKKARRRVLEEYSLPKSFESYRKVLF